MIVSINKEMITTYDLSQRIKLALKSLNLEDSISNRDSVRERMLELLILEKIKMIEAKKNNISHTEEELINFTSNIYNFSKDDFNGFKSFLEEEGFDIDILLDQMSSELLWKKFLQKTIASKIIISEQEIQAEVQKQLRMMPGQEKMVMDFYQKNPSALASLRGTVYEEKILNLIKEKGKANKKEISKEEAEKILKEAHKHDHDHDHNHGEEKKETKKKSSTTSAKEKKPATKKAKSKPAAKKAKKVSKK